MEILTKNKNNIDRVLTAKVNEETSLIFTPNQDGQISFLLTNDGRKLNLPKPLRVKAGETYEILTPDQIDVIEFRHLTRN